MKWGMSRGIVLACAASLGRAAASDALEFEARAGAVVAREGDVVVWENLHDRGRRLTSPIVGPVVAGELLYYAVASHLYEVHPGSGIVRRRIILPGVCSTLAPEGNDVIVGVASASPELTWSRSYRLGPAGSDVPFFLPGNLVVARLPRSDAAAVLTSLLEADKNAPKPNGSESDWRRKPEFKPHLAAAVAELKRLAERDPTNPWYRYFEGLYLRDLGREEEALFALRSTLTLGAENDHALLALALPLDDISPELGSEAFERGLGFLLAHGYEPELMSSALAVLTHYGSPNRDRSLPGPIQDVNRLNQLGERMWDLAPHSEWVAALYKGLANVNREAGHMEAAQAWDSRSSEALPYRSFGVPSAPAEWTGTAVNAVSASVVALLLTLFVKALRTHAVQRRLDGWSRLNPFASWTRGEIVGFLLVQALLFVSWVGLARGAAAIARLSAMPVTACAGNLGHPDAVEFLARLQGSPGGDFVYALALEQAGEMDRAAAILERLASPRARNNLGVILISQGKPDEARRLFEQALAAEPGLTEAAYNLGQPVHSARIDRLGRYGFSGPVLAMPRATMWSEAFGGGEWRFDIRRPLNEILPRSAADVPVLARSGVIQTALLLLLLLSLLALAGLVARRPAAAAAERSTVGSVGWALGFLVPGTSRHNGFLGPPLLALCLFSLLVHMALVSSEGLATNVLESIAVPGVARQFGVAGTVHTPLDLLVRRAQHLWWILWIANFAAVAVIEALAPDPQGPRAKAQPMDDAAVWA